MCGSDGDSNGVDANSLRHETAIQQTYWPRLASMIREGREGGGGETERDGSL